MDKLMVYMDNEITILGQTISVCGEGEEDRR